MGNLEDAGRKRKHRRDFRYAILTATQTAALVGVFLMAPNMPQALYKLGLFPQAAGDRSVIARARRQMLKKGLLTQKDGKFDLTQKGRTALAVLNAKYSIQKPSRWDGRWRVLIFDVPEYRKSVRDKIRRTLMHIGFVRLQDSVWAYPHDCEDLVLLLKADFRIGKDVLYMIVDELEGDSKLRKEFGLKKR